jgi:hypothetical protein
MPESFDELLETFYHKIMGYAQPSVADDVSVPPMEVNEEPSPTAPAAPVVQEHHCEKHNVGFNKNSKGYSHKVANSNGYCHEGVEGIYDWEGNPLTEMV